MASLQQSGPLEASSYAIDISMLCKYDKALSSATTTNYKRCE